MGLRLSITIFQKEIKKFVFNHAHNTFYLWLYGVGHMVKNHSHSERKPATTMDYSFLYAASDLL